MKISEARILITGGAGGIGTALACELLEHGAAVMLVDRDIAALEGVSRLLARYGERVCTVAGDLTQDGDRRRLLDKAARWHGGINVLVNNAGVNHFLMFGEQSPEQIDVAIAVNIQAPLHLCRLFLPLLQRQGEAHIVNMGSVFGAIGYPAYAVYSATKFAMRGFSEALRRELAGTTTRVHYLAPRATLTGINSTAVTQMNAALGTAMDPPERVARALRRMLEANAAESVVGWPEAFFARLNAAFPRLVDGAIHRQLPIIERFAKQSPPPAPAKSGGSTPRPREA
jgi:short-subunit dehydrogenase